MKKYLICIDLEEDFGGSTGVYINSDVKPELKGEGKNRIVVIGDIEIEVYNFESMNVTERKKGT